MLMNEHFYTTIEAQKALRDERFWGNTEAIEAEATDEPYFALLPMRYAVDGEAEIDRILEDVDRCYAHLTQDREEAKRYLENEIREGNLGSCVALLQANVKLYAREDADIFEEMSCSFHTVTDHFCFPGELEIPA